MKVVLYLREKASAGETDAEVMRCALDAARRVGVQLPEELIIARPGGGKPVFANVHGLHFSVSHSGPLWACAFFGAPVGLDVQQHTRCNMRGVARRFFHHDEHAWLERTQYREFFSLWCAKESYVKYLGRGIDDGFDDFCVVKDEALTETMDGAYFRHLHGIEGFSACVCAGRRFELESDARGMFMADGIG
jgi:phosphopantetheinyl transferase